MTTHQTTSDQITTLGIYDDWHDGQLTDRLPYSFAGTKNIGARRELPVEWIVENGSPSAGIGRLKLPAGDSTVQEVSADYVDNQSCRWEITFAFQSTPSTGSFKWHFAKDGGDARWRIEWDINNSNVELITNGDTFTDVEVQGGLSPDSNTHTIAVESGPNKDKELFIDGASQGTVNENYWRNDQDNQRIENTADAEVHVKQIRIDYRT
jgi:hypothetical protein